jgi:hypothetical protein
MIEAPILRSLEYSSGTFLFTKCSDLLFRDPNLSRNFDIRAFYNMRRMKPQKWNRTSSSLEPQSSPGNFPNSAQVSTASTQSNSIVAKSTTFISGCSLQTLLNAAESERKKSDINNGGTGSKALITVISFAQQIDRFAQALDLYAQVSPQVACLVWGSLRVLIKVDSLLVSSSKLGKFAWCCRLTHFLRLP